MAENNRFYTFMIVPERSSNVKKWMVSNHTIKIFCGMICLFILMSGVTAFYTAQYFAHKQEFKQASVKNHFLESELAQIQNQLGVTDSTLVRVQNFEQKLRVITQLDAQPTTANVGPISEDEDRIMRMGLDQEPLSSQMKASHKHVQAIHFDINRVAKRASLQEQSLQELYELLKDQRSILASTPSIKPVEGYYTSGFGYRISPFTGNRQLHAGIDLFAPIGTAVRATADGVVTRVDTDPGYGKLVVVSHGYGFSTLYAHNSKILAKVGQHIKRGQTISQVGNTGRTTGPHLHYEVKLNGHPINPVKYILN